MTKIPLFAVLAGAVLFFAACQTPGAEAPPQNGAPARDAQVQTPTAPPAARTYEEAARDVYQRFLPGLILTGASNHTVRPGDTLVNIAWHHFNDGFMYPVILLASSHVVLDPDRITPDMEIIVPDLQRNLNDPAARQNIRNFLLEIADLEDSRNRSATAAGIRERANNL